MPLFFRTKKTFFEAAAMGDTEELQYCVESGKFGINTRNISGDTVLHVAIEARHVDTVKMLLEFGPDLSLTGKDGLTPLMLAMGKGKPEMSLAIVKAKGSDPDTHDSEYIYPLHLAAEAGEMDLVKALVERGADVNVRRRDTEDTPLHLAIEKGRRGVAEYLVKKGARTDIAGKEGKTATQLAKEVGPQMLKIVNPELAANERMREAPMEVWELAAPAQVAKISTLPALQRKITEIFNFETRERVTVSHNLKTGAESVGESESFLTLGEDVVAIATEKLKVLGGQAPGRKPPSSLSGSPVGKFRV